ncbi:MAG TPA: pilus assembly protein PilM [Solirubrobacteraceae bacterium]|jgi:type IV pilus assembly protein PilM|nr:pilus assembly protein PilM [Solirubrobacteraceae bacterium]
MRIPSPQIKFGQRSGADVVGLDIQPGFIAAVKARVNGSIAAERAATLALPADTVRDGEVLDAEVLSESLRELFADSGLGKRVRVGVANQRTVLRTLELPPVTDEKELAAAVNFQAQEQVPMPLSNAVLDFHPLGIVDTPAGPRQRVVLVAAQRDMVERLLSAVREAGLTPAGVDLSAFALIRSLYRSNAEQQGRVLYLNVDGLTNLAIAEGRICRFTRVVGSGLEGMAAELAERRSIALVEARALLAGVDLSAPAAFAEPPAEAFVPGPVLDEPQDGDAAEVAADAIAEAQAQAHAEAQDGAEAAPAEHFDEAALGYEELAIAPVLSEPETVAEVSDEDVRLVLENGIRDISGEVRNSLDFHRSQEGGGEVSHIVLSGAAQDVPGFAEALQLSLGVNVLTEDVHLVEGGLASGIAPHRLAVATGLAAVEAPQ